TRDGQGVVLAAHSTGEGGEPRPKGPTGGKATPGITTSGGTYGRDSGLTNRIHETPENCPAGQGLSGHGVQQCVARDRPGVLAGSLSPAPEEQCSRHGPRYGAAVRRASGREPAGPACAAARQAVCGAASRAGVDRAGRWEAEAHRATLLRGQDRPAGSGDAPGGDLRGGLPCLLPWLQEGAQSPSSAARTA